MYVEIMVKEMITRRFGVEIPDGTESPYLNDAITKVEDEWVELEEDSNGGEVVQILDADGNQIWSEND